jgi:L-aspartate oxidase
VATARKIAMDYVECPTNSGKLRVMKKPILQRGKRIEFDVLIIGSGIAGLTLALDLVEKKQGIKIALMTKKTLDECNSHYAQGGMAAATEIYDSIEKHIQDTLIAGGGLCDAQVVTEILSRGSLAIERLTRYGAAFDDTLAQEGGHSERRIHHVGDASGKAIIDALIRHVHLQRQITLLEHHTAINLIADEKESSVIGAYVLDEEKNKIHTLLSRVTVLATGGAGKVYRYTSNRDVATGDGVAMAHRVGAKISNMEFYQFHPTLLYHHQENNFLITEALRGEGAYLLNANTLERFMGKYAPEKMELATRDIVARAIFNEIETGEKDFVYLDVRHKDPQFLQQRFPMIFEKLLSLGIDMRVDLIPVVPAAHYMCGGVVADIDGTTNIKRLLAIGETSCTGLHGANRLASNSLLEGAVMAMLAVEPVSQWVNQLVDHSGVSDWCSESVIDLRRASQINAHWRGLRGEMTSYAGIIRTEAGLKDLLKLIKTRREMIENYYWKHVVTRDLIELRNIILVAELIVSAALDRKESRGGHYREDADLFV